MMLRRETNFFARSLRHGSALIFNFSNIKRGYKVKIYELYHKSFVKIYDIKKIFTFIV